MNGRARLLESHFAAPHTKVFRFRADTPSPLRFRPGQYLMVRDEHGQHKATAYSLASPPRDDATFDLCLNRVEHSGSFSSYLFALPPGAAIRFDGPCGDFLLRDPVRDSLFVSTGTGIAPFRSMLHHLLAAGCAAQLTLLFGVRYEENLLFRDEFEKLAAGHPNFSFVPTLSRPGERWTGASGYVQEHIDRLLAGRADMDVYICGLKSMVDEVRSELQKNNFDPASIFHEKFD